MFIYFCNFFNTIVNVLYTFNYNEIDRQLKEQFIHWLSDTQMLAEIMSELTKAEEKSNMTSD